MRNLAVSVLLLIAGFVLGRETIPARVHGDTVDNGRYTLSRPEAATNFYDRGVFFLDSASGAVYLYDWDKKELIEVPKIKP